jgi:hypothetical protein
MTSNGTCTFCGFSGCSPECKPAYRVCPDCGSSTPDDGGRCTSSDCNVSLFGPDPYDAGGFCAA